MRVPIQIVAPQLAVALLPRADKRKRAAEASVPV